MVAWPESPRLLQSKSEDVLALQHQAAVLPITRGRLHRAPALKGAQRRRRLVDEDFRKEALARRRA